MHVDKQAIMATPIMVLKLKMSRIIEYDLLSVLGAGSLFNLSQDRILSSRLVLLLALYIIVSAVHECYNSPGAHELPKG